MACKWSELACSSRHRSHHKCCTLAIHIFDHSSVFLEHHGLQVVGAGVFVSASQSPQVLHFGHPHFRPLFRIPRAPWPASGRSWRVRLGIAVTTSAALWPSTFSTTLPYSSSTMACKWSELACSSRHRSHHKCCTL